ncbi:hypothetical protein H4R20_001594 [Coemansia guatemalensis]|uniref:Uncharacterized protein n=1 Tax=Coemansia guatemalensis TaxID=2761395 RepID=A0A9W8I1M4_9FUNG|nr:hypothetical protein H4R20_001594 [Coemansia guatemalensis]
MTRKTRSRNFLGKGRSAVGSRQAARGLSGTSESQTAEAQVPSHTPSGSQTELRPATLHEIGARVAPLPDFSTQRNSWTDVAAAVEIAMELAERMYFQRDWMAELVREQLTQDSHSVALTEDLSEALKTLSEDMAPKEAQRKAKEPVHEGSDKGPGLSNVRRMEEKELVECINPHRPESQPMQQPVMPVSPSARTSAVIDSSTHESDQPDSHSGSVEGRAAKPEAELEISEEKQQIRAERMARIVKAIVQEEGYDEAVAEEMIALLTAIAEKTPGREKMQVSNEVINVSGIVMQKMDAMATKLEDIKNEAHALIQTTDKPQEEIRKEVDEYLKKAGEVCAAVNRL